MIPKKPKVIYKELAEETGRDEQLIEDLMSYYYRKIRMHMSDLKYPRIHIDGLGQFVVKPKTVEKLINKYTKVIATLDGYSLASYHNKIRLEQRLVELNNIHEVILEEKETKEQFKRTKNEKSKGDLEE